VVERVSCCAKTGRKGSEKTHLVEEVLDELNLVRNLSTAEDGKEGALRLLKDLGKVLELLGHEETSRLLGKVNADHGRVSAVGGSEGVVDVNVAKLGEARTELLDLLRVSLGLLALLVLARTLLLDVEPQVLKEEDAALLGLSDGLLRLGTDAVREEGDGLVREETLEFGSDGLEGVLLDDFAVGAAEVRGEDDRVGAGGNGVLDGGEGGGDALLSVTAEENGELGGKEKKRRKSVRRFERRGVLANAILDYSTARHRRSLSRIPFAFSPSFPLIHRYRLLEFSST
jgi:hypothetical protein